MINIQQIKYFLTLAQKLHFCQIQALERELGVQLFERDKRNVKLTSAGQFLREKWEVQINQLELFHEHARQIQLGESGTIIIAHPDSISASLMPDMLTRIALAYPKLKIELVQTSVFRCCQYYHSCWRTNSINNPPFMEQSDSYSLFYFS